MSGQRAPAKDLISAQQQSTLNGAAGAPRTRSVRVLLAASYLDGGIIMSASLSAQQILGQEFLEIRARLIAVAALLDRLDRAEGSVAEDPRLHKIHQALEVLKGRKPDRAEQLQLIFSLPYEENWQTKLAVERRAPAASNGR